MNRSKEYSCSFTHLVAHALHLGAIEVSLRLRAAQPPVNAGDVEAANDRAAAADASDASRRSGPVVAEAESQRKYHFEVRGAEAKRDFDRSKVKCMCHEVSEGTTVFL